MAVQALGKLRVQPEEAEAVAVLGHSSLLKSQQVRSRLQLLSSSRLAEPEQLLSQPTIPLAITEPTDQKQGSAILWVIAVTEETLVVIWALRAVPLEAALGVCLFLRAFLAVVETLLQVASQLLKALLVT